MNPHDLAALLAQPRYVERKAVRDLAQAYLDLEAENERLRELAVRLDTNLNFGTLYGEAAKERDEAREALAEIRDYYSRNAPEQVAFEMATRALLSEDEK